VFSAIMIITLSEGSRVCITEGKAYLETQIPVFDKEVRQQSVHGKEMLT